MRPQIFPLRPNRVFRSYPGGRVLDEISHLPDPRDTDFPEDWIASTTRAINPNRDDASEGISRLEIGGEAVRFDEILAQNPDFFVGAAYFSRFGARIAPLVKFLDAGVRLHFQCHPTLAFARRHFNSEWGKTEAYHILHIRAENPNPHLYLGFQFPPPRDEMRRLILEQDMANLERCFEPIRVREGETYLVPGGIPHAIGAGITMVEVMEPTDLVARFEWEKAGVKLAENAKFMGRDVEFGLEMLDFSRFSVEEVRRNFQPKPRKLDESRELLLGEPHTRAFRLEKWTIDGEMKADLASFAIAIVLNGECEAEIAGQRWSFRRLERFFVPFAARELILRGHNAQLLMIFPPSF